MELLFHSFGIVVLVLFYTGSSNGNRMYNARVLPIVFRLRIYNRYQTPLPWKPDQPDLPNNRSVAEGRLKSLLRRFERDPDFELHYRKAMGR